MSSTQQSDEIAVITYPIFHRLTEVHPCLESNNYAVETKLNLGKTDSQAYAPDQQDSGMAQEEEWFTKSGVIGHGSIV